MEIRVYYEDTDCGNVVYYANYLKYMERSRTEYLRDRGIDLAEYQRNGITFVVVEAHVKYRSPAQYNDLLTVESSVVEMTSATVMFTTNITRRGQLLVKGDVKLACLTSSGKAGKIPQEIRDALVS
ncbi:MAG: YbgC/FadM family acyl-CoA thioesterase [Fibrobacter sp.]|nr:YbgC/FadM family acyl-CoA thioesterase [Fibrobacter sp.]